MKLGTKYAECRMLLALGATTLACVPASEERPPAGAAGFTTEPSAAARGEAITTDDGWVVRFEKVLVHASVSASPLPEHMGDGSYYADDTFFWNAAARVEVYVPALKIGTYDVRIGLQGESLPSTGEVSTGEAANLGVSREDEARFRRAPDEQVSSRQDGSMGPNLWVVLRAERGDRVVVLDLAMNAPAAIGDQSRRVEVRADALASIPLGVAPERLLTDERDGSRLRFDPIADADADSDGRVTAIELARAPAIALPLGDDGGGSNEPRPGTGGVDPDAPDETGGFGEPGLMGTLQRRGPTIFVR